MPQLRLRLADVLRQHLRRSSFRFLCRSIVRWHLAVAIAIAPRTTTRHCRRHFVLPSAGAIRQCWSLVSFHSTASSSSCFSIIRATALAAIIRLRSPLFALRLVDATARDALELERAARGGAVVAVAAAHGALTVAGYDGCGVNTNGQDEGMDWRHNPLGRDVRCQELGHRFPRRGLAQWGN